VRGRSQLAQAGPETYLLKIRRREPSHCNSSIPIE
jgi:hypothetical protein